MAIAAASLAGPLGPSVAHADALRPGTSAEPVESLVDRFAHQPFDLSAAVGLDEAYDSNVYNGRGPDYVTRLSPHLSAALRGPLGRIDASYDLGLWNYAEGKASSTVNQRGRLSFDVNPTRRLTLHVADELTRAQDPGYLIRAGVVAPQTGITDNIADVLAGLRVARRADVSLGYSFRLTRFDQIPGVPLHDGDEHDAAAAFVYRVTRLDDLRVDYRFAYYTADGSGLAVGNSPGLGWRHQIVRDLEARVDAGPVYYDALRNNGTNVSGWTWRGDATLRYYTPTWRAAVSYVHDLVGGTGAATVLWADYVYGQVGYHFNERLDAHAGVGFFANGYAPEQQVNYEGVNGDLIVDVRIISNLRAGAYYSFRWQEQVHAPIDVPVGADPFPQVTRHIVGLRLLAVIGSEARPPRREVHP